MWLGVCAARALPRTYTPPRGVGPNERAPEGVSAFAGWFDCALTENRVADLIAYRDRAPYARKNHPTEEHLLPLYAALGAAGDAAQPERLHASSTYGVLRMDVYAFRQAYVEAAPGDARVGDDSEPHPPALLIFSRRTLWGSK